ncbi:toprim domain-containing protein [Prevotella melaninogenica]|uniref:toprim domain-containing protein n=1 Tax=Prevotella melaninogenica TaxID=28132 RepID=UPI001C6055B6|nr:toprim domain-containing protein [Prevotella melaninogenica]MBW4735059.1 toprim domain-containing protein [Prevotella melaninogenica]MBW4737467.1 toprim domain-containing protein [Prevotella melaninogenica]MBW4879998.1 toprim domain-containing protein [Prevotella melaninogenica]
MKEKDLSAIKRYPVVEYLERKGIKPVRRTPAYALYRSPLREETHPSFKVDTQKNLWIDYGEGRGGSIIDLCMRMEGCTLSEAIRRLGQNASDKGTYSSLNDFVPNNSQPVMAVNGARRLIEISDTLPPHFQEYLTKVRCINLEKAMPFLKRICYEVRGRRYQAIGFANLSGGYELRDDKTFKGTIAPKDITPIFTDRAEPICIFEGFMDFLSFLSMKEKITNHCLVMNSVSNVTRTIHYLNERHLTHIRTFLDNDEAGRRAVQDFIKAGFHVENMNIHYKDFKDLNGFHVSRVREQQKRKTQEQTHISITGQNKKSKQVKLKMK